MKETARVAGRVGIWVDTFVRDLGFSVRLLAKTPAFSLTAILILSLGIGANAAVFSLVNLLLFRPLRGAEAPGTPVGVYTHDPGRAGSYRSFSYPEFERIRDEAGVFTQVTAVRPARVGVQDGDAARRTRAEMVTSGYFATLGVRLVAGRTFTRDEERPGSRAALVVLSYPCWQRLGGRADVLGRTLTVNGLPFTVIGIAPEGFTGSMALAGPEFWMPLGVREFLFPADGTAAAAPPPERGLMLIGRLAPGLTVEAAQGAMRTLSGRLAAFQPQEGARNVLSVHPLARGQRGDAPANDTDLFVPLGALIGAALILLVIASLNVANMQLARGASRRKEMAMRLALGAGRGRIVAQLLTEGLVLSLLGGAAGLVFSVWSLHAALASFRPLVDQTLSADLTPDWRVWLASLACCTLASLTVALGPARRLSRLDLQPEMKSQDRLTGGSGLGRFGTRNLLVGAQVALSLALLAAAGLFVRGAMVAGAADPGYRFDRQLLVRIDPTLGGYDTAAGRQAYGRLMERIRTAPGVEAASVASLIAFGNDGFTRRVVRPEASGAAIGVQAQSFAVGTAYFRTLGLAMLRGREFTEAEEREPASSPVAIIDAPLAAALFPGQDPLGQRIRFVTAVPPGQAVSPGSPTTLQVVGVAPGLRHRITDLGPVAHVYLPLGSDYHTLLNLHVRTSAPAGTDLRATKRSVARLIRETDSRLAVIGGVQTLEEFHDAVPTTWLIRAAAHSFGAFGAIALFMAAAGLYGVKAYLVTRRTREIGIRLALGASAGAVIRMVVGEGAVLLGASLGVGLVLALGAGWAVSSLLVGVRPFDPIVLSASTLVLAVAVLAACYAPARRATRISPVTALRVE